MQRMFSRSLLITCLSLSIAGVAADGSRAADTPWSASPGIVKKFAARRGSFNYDESKIPDYVLPDPLVAVDGKPVSSAERWNVTRRTELMELFRGTVYGRRPQVKFTVRFEKTAEVTDAFDGAATGRSMRAVIAIARSDVFISVCRVCSQSGPGPGAGCCAYQQPLLHPAGKGRRQSRSVLAGENTDRARLRDRFVPHVGC